MSARIQSKVKPESSGPAGQPNGRHDVITSTSGLTRTPSLHNYALTSSAADPPTAAHDDRHVVTSRVDGFGDEVNPLNSTSFSPTQTSPAGPLRGDGGGVAGAYCPDDYDNMADDDDNNNNNKTHTSTAGYLPSERRPGAAPPRSTIRSGM